MTPLAKRFLLWSIPTIAVVAGLVYAFQPRPIAADLVTVTRGPLEVRVEAEGKTRVRDVYRLSAPVAGEVQRLTAEVGDAVVAHETVLAVVSPAAPGFLDTRGVAEARASVAAAEAAETEAAAAVRRAEADDVYARAELSRIGELARDGTAARRSLDRARSDADMAAAGLESARALLEVRRHELEVARARLMQPDSRAPAGSCCIEVRTPVDGRVLAVLQESRAVVAAGAPLVDVGDPRDLEVVADFLSTDAVAIRPGAAAVLDDWGGAPLAATVRMVEPTAFTKVSALGIDEQRVNVVLDFAAPPPDALGHGFHVMARVVVWRTDDTLIVPLGALFRDADGWAVFRVEDGVARKHAVQVERLGAERAAIAGGLETGDVLVLHPSDRIADGVTVEARPPG